MRAFLSHHILYMANLVPDGKKKITRNSFFKWVTAPILKPTYDQKPDTFLGALVFSQRELHREQLVCMIGANFTSRKLSDNNLVILYTGCYKCCTFYLKGGNVFGNIKRNKLISVLSKLITCSWFIKHPLKCWRLKCYYFNEINEVVLLT